MTIYHISVAPVTTFETIKMGGRTRIFAKCYITNVGYYQEWTPNNISTRVNSNGGHYQQKISNETTHLVVTPKAWKAQGTVVKHALELNRDSGRDIKIVSFDWLDDSWNNENRKNETPYQWEKLDPKSKDPKGNDEPKKVQKANGKQTKEVEGPKSYVGMMAEVFQESTDKFVDATEKKRIEKQIESARRVRAEMEKEEREERELKDKEKEKTAATFQKGAKKARNDIFSGRSA